MREPLFSIFRNSGFAFVRWFSFKTHYAICPYLSVCRIGPWPVMRMLDRIFESSVTGSEMWSCTWSNKRVKSCYRARARLHTDQGNLW